MAKSHRKGFQPDAAEARLRARLEDESKQPDADTALRAQIEFWTRLHAILAANESSYGLEALDNLALALMDEDNGGQAVLEAVVSILPSPVLMHTGQVQASEIFQLPTAHTRSSKRNNSRTPPKASTAKKQRTFKNARTVIPYSFDLPEDVEDQIHQDLDRLITEAAKKDKTPPRVAYPWKGQRVWYDPAMYPLLHQKCWLFWMRFRYVVLLLALYPPTNNAVARRKLKASALPTRLQLLSAFIEKLRYYDLMTAFDEGVHDNLMWFRGKAVKHSSGAKQSDDSYDSGPPAQENLAVVYKRECCRYDSIVARALDPYQVDEDGYSLIPELIEQCQALDPTRPKNLVSLTTRSLVSPFDVASGHLPNESWVGNRTKGPWKNLLTDRSLRVTQIAVAKLLSTGKSAATFFDRPLKASDKSDDDLDIEEDDVYTKMEIFRLARRWVPLETEYRTMLDARPWVDLWNKRIKFFYFHRLSKLTSKEIVVLDEYLEYVRDHVQAHCEPRHRLTMK
ncbi:hypothetical protein PI125_g4141 [Phytophthora idaei]|nr:hypothetical protein PI125_g4141 [Phytophthora idaei]